MLSLLINVTEDAENQTNDWQQHNKVSASTPLINVSLKTDLHTDRVCQIGC